MLIIIINYKSCVCAQLLLSGSLNIKVIDVYKGQRFIFIQFFLVLPDYEVKLLSDSTTIHILRFHLLTLVTNGNNIQICENKTQNVINWNDNLKCLYVCAYESNRTKNVEFICTV